MKAYTPDQKKTYFAGLREQWKANKEAAEKDGDARAQYDAMKRESPSMSVSYWSFYFTLSAMRRQGMDGLPYIDAKTFNGWRGAGFQVRKGEKSTLDGITWIEVRGKDEPDDEGFMLPKKYALFHRRQVDAIE